MSEERFDKLEAMMTDLLRMVGSNNSSLEQLRSDVKTLNGRVDTIEQHLAGLTEKVYSLDTKVDALDTKVNSLDTKVGALDAKVDRNHKELIDRFDRVETQIDILSARSVRHEAEIQVLKKVK